MKRFVVLLSVLILAFVIAACGNSAQARRLQHSQDNALLERGSVLL